MSGWLYLIRNRDLYKIGITKYFDKRMRQLKPDNVVAKLYSRDYIKLEKELHNRYKKFRIPQTEYFRLEVYHLKEINKRLSTLDFQMSIILAIFIKSLIFTIVLFFLILLFLSLNINDTSIISLKLVIWMERISFGCSFLSLFLKSGKHLGFSSELKYRFSMLTVFMLFAFFFRIATIFLQ
tara:strand:+ start:434 stop:976 length:543 start_codon:yes stop_codon:yes gene_type:complete